MNDQAGAMAAAEQAGIDQIATMFAPYRFRVCQTYEEARAAFEIRRQVYQEACAYTVRVPDDIDLRSWFLLAEEFATGKPIGTMRATSRAYGPFELEQHFRLPEPLRSPRAVELSRFAIIPEYRRGQGAPVVSLGLCNLLKRFLDSLGAEYMIFAAKAKQALTYSWMRFTSTGIRARYDDLGDEEHELMFGNMARADLAIEGHPFKPVLDGYPFPSGVLPARTPPLGLGTTTMLRAVGS
jgi:hypothetical protein